MMIGYYDNFIKYRVKTDESHTFFVERVWSDDRLHYEVAELWCEARGAELVDFGRWGNE